MRVIESPLASIKIGERAREEKGDLESMMESIKEKGILQPLVVDQKMNLLAGERRYLAAEALDMKFVPTFMYHTKGPVDPLEIELIENIERKDFTWQERAKLEKKIEDLKRKKDPKWSRRKQAALVGTALSTVNRRVQLAEAMQLLPDLADHDTEDGAWKALKKLEERVVVQEITRRVSPEIIKASKWAERHYMVGDAFAGMKKCKAEIAHFAEVDPPYGVDLKDVKSRNKNDDNTGRYTEIDATEYVDFFRRTAIDVFRVMRKDAFAIFWFGPTWFSETRDVLRKVGFKVPDIPAIWTKGLVGQTASPDTTFGSCYEPFWLARKGKPKLYKPGRGNVFAFPPVHSSKKIHSTEKPLALMISILDTILLPGSAIMSPFLGSGVTLRAAYRLGHTGWGYDLDEDNKELFLSAVREDLKAAEEKPEDEEIE